MVVTLSPEFQQAVIDSKKLTAKPSNEDLLSMYGLYKQALQDPAFKNADQPGTFDFKGKAKYKAWQAVVDEKITPEDAQTKYVELINVMKKKYEYDASKEPEAVGGSS